MTSPTTQVDTLRERLLQPELAAARSILAADGLGGLIGAATARLKDVAEAHARFQRLVRDLDGSLGSERMRRVAAYLQEVVPDERALAADMRALKRGEPNVLDLAALGERLAQQCDALECRAEACLALGRLAVAGLPSQVLESVLALATRRGRWSRRVEALRWLASLRFSAVDAPLRDRILVTLTDMTSAEEQRWVQPAALATLAAIEPAAAHLIARKRLLEPASGDDFLVRGAIVLLIGLKKSARWLDVLSLAHEDSSEHVRITAARVQRNAAVLRRVAKDDESHRVRASALIRLARKHPASASISLRSALFDDAHGFVVQTAAEELVRIGNRSPERIEVDVLSALAAATRRSELSAVARAAARDALVELQAQRQIPPAVFAELRRAVQATPIGGSSSVIDKGLRALSEEALAQALAVVARDDFGIGIDRLPDRLVLHRGERTAFSWWRTLFELFHPAPDKRQGVSHTVARRLSGALRSPPGGLAEATATRVPGERVLAANRGDWGRDVPRVEDLVTRVADPSAIHIASASGSAEVLPPASFLRRIRAFCALILRYPRLAESRQRALESDDPLVRASYAREVHRLTGITIEVVPYAFDVATPAVEAPEPASSSSVGLVPMLPFGALLSPQDHFASLWEGLRDLGSGGDVGLSHLAGYGAWLLGGLLARQIVIRRRIDAERRAIPLVIGGWGTRGKSGSERLKAALFQGLGYECLVKTTGCEAMFIHAIPGLPAREVFIYRPYDKATVWEQRSVLSLAGRLGVRVFLWECMALQPELVNLLQSQWMRDDCSTITNTYPDHEDLQGPTGFDVAQTISEFVPQHSTVLTSELQMLPLLRARAAARGTRLVAVPARAAELISEDLLARFGHAEHPANIALVAALARRAGVSESVAIAEMADHVVADLGALKTYPTVEWRGRRLSFTNGMGANDRAATLENWQRAGFDEHASVPGSSGWVVTVVNNRADRPARTGVFGELLVKDIVADRHVLIGTNLPGLRRAIESALDEQIHALSPTRDLPDQRGLHQEVIAERLARAFGRLQIRGSDIHSVVSESRRLNIPLPSESLVRRLLLPTAAESYSAAKQRVQQGLAEAGESEASPFLISLIARRRVLLALQGMPTPSLQNAFAAAYRAIFLEGVVMLPDAGITGDGIIEALATQLPDGAAARIMGMQNIKGTGLDFVYRWVSVEIVTKACTSLESSDLVARQQALTALMVHDDYGVVDVQLARDAVQAAATRDPKSSLPYAAASRKLNEIAEQRVTQLGPNQGRGWGARLERAIGETLDFADAVRRRRMAARVLDALASAQISHATAAQRMRRVLQRSKGGWLVKNG